MTNKQFWLYRRLAEVGKTRKDIADELGIAVTRLSEMEKNQWKFKVSHIEKVSDILQFDKTSLVRFLSGQATEEELWNSKPPEQTTDTIPVIGYVQAGLWQEARQWEVSDFKPIYVPTDERFKGKRVYALEIRGNSMNLLYPAGSFVVCISTEDYADIIGNVESGKKVVVERKNPLDGSIEATVKEYVKNEYGTFLMPHSTDPSFTPIRTDDGSAGEVKITGVVIGSFKME
jgi:SOS-response transcriptional repressor LexA